MARVVLIAVVLALFIQLASSQDAQECITAQITIAANAGQCFGTATYM